MRQTCLNAALYRLCSATVPPPSSRLLLLQTTHRESCAICWPIPRHRFDSNLVRSVQVSCNSGLTTFAAQRVVHFGRTFVVLCLLSVTLSLSLSSILFLILWHRLINFCFSPAARLLLLYSCGLSTLYYVDVLSI